ncbi:hypothetical protein ABK040_009119 [Willaertia magna]
MSDKDSQASEKTDDNQSTTDNHQEKDPLRRVKLYHLSDEGQWIDKGTGHCYCETTKKNEMFLTVISESSGDTLLESAISLDDIYQLQNATLIVWSDPDSKLDMALSFQHVQGCILIWDEIRKIQGRKPDGKEIVERNKQAEEDLSDVDVDDEVIHTTSKFHLPEPKTHNLNELLNLITENKYKVAKYITFDYISKLFNVFDECEDSESVNDCRILFKIFTHIISLDETDILDYLFNNENIMKLIGVLEYDPDLPTRKANHRNYLKNVVVFKQVIPFNNNEILDKIHQTFRIQYIKETILASIIDDQTFNTLSNLIYKNNTFLVNAIRDDESFLNNLFQSLLSDETPIERQRDLSKFLNEFNNLLKMQGAYTRLDCLKQLVNDYPLLDVIEKHLRSENTTIRHIYADILLSITQVLHITFLERLKQRQANGNFNFIKVVILGIVSESEMGIQDNLTEIIKLIFDPEVNSCDTFLQQFYDHHMELLASPILSPATCIDKFNKVSIKVSCLNHSLDLLAFTVTYHKYRSKNFIIYHDILPKVIHLLSVYKEKDLILAVIRFFKSVILKGDIFLNNNILNNNLFHPIMEIWRKNSNTYNLINSAIIDLFESVRNSGSMRLKTHVVDHFKHDFEKVDYVETFKTLIDECEEEKNMDAKEPQSENAEDAYFYESSNSSDLEETQKQHITQNGTTDGGLSTTSTEEDEFITSLTHHKKEAEDDEEDGVFSSPKKDNHSNALHKIQINLKTSSSPTKGEVEPTTKKVKIQN